MLNVGGRTRTTIEQRREVASAKCEQSETLKLTVIVAEEVVVSCGMKR